MLRTLVLEAKMEYRVNGMLYSDRHPFGLQLGTPFTRIYHAKLRFAMNTRIAAHHDCRGDPMMLRHLTRIVAFSLITVPIVPRQASSQMGDFNGDMVLDCQDLDLLQADIRAGTNNHELEPGA